MRAYLPLLALLLCAACSKKEHAEPTAEETALKKSTGKKLTAEDEAKAAASAEELSKKKKKAAEAAAPERTKVPTLAEWNAAKEVEAKGNAVGCEVKEVREWVRVSCRKKSPGGGDPSGVAIERGRNKETFSFVGKGVTSVVTPLLPGTDLLAKYSWSDVVYAVRIAWKKDEGRPAAFAHFVKTDDRPEKPLGVATCDCFKKVNKGARCDDSDDRWMIVQQNPWCERSFAGDCETMIGCATGAPSAKPKCPAGHLASIANYCLKICETAADCPSGYTCDEYLDTKACFENG
ncbi:MAG: hypothetical protein HYV09_02675 [Deltaproteobacteria bacterium]|nr:hypothetical protein [Deltaproteobacteria bacterium]